jgi:hypothetical protein
MLVIGADGFRPCTPLGVMKLLEAAGYALKGKNAVVVGRSNIVGKPVALMLLEKHATVTICHSRTASLRDEVARADVLVVAIGKAGLVRGDWIKPGAVVIDEVRIPRRERVRFVKVGGQSITEMTALTIRDSVERLLTIPVTRRMIIVVDDEDRENEGDLIMAAEFATPDKIAFFLHHTSGVICAPVTRERARELDLPLMVAHNTESMRTAFLVSVDLRLNESESRIRSYLDRALRAQTRTLMLGMVGAMFTMTSLCLGAIAFTG